MEKERTCLRLMPGDVVRHFKYETLTDEEKSRNLYTYLILSMSKHTETGEVMVNYVALYSDKTMCVHFGQYSRPFDMFMSKVDRDKYPNIKQEYRFELADFE